MNDWRTIWEVESNTIFSKVRVGDDVAIWSEGATDWETGIVEGIEMYKSPSTRWIERPVLKVKLHNAENRVSGPYKMFYEENVEEILFKD